MYRPKNCMACGGRMKTYQDGGELPLIDNGTQYFQTGFDQNGNPLAYDANNATYEQATKAEQFTTTNPVQFPGSNNFLPPQEKLEKKGMGWSPYLGMRTAKTLFAELANRAERKRQDQYWYNQQSTLGQMNPMPYQDFQPNKFSMYAKYGGNIKKYAKKG